MNEIVEAHPIEQRQNAQYGQLDSLKKLRAPFEAHQISLLPKPYKKDSPKGQCNECGGYHALPAMHLSYVGHAALTDRLLDVDPLWTWEPMAIGADGTPVRDKDGGMWIRLTICGVTRLGYGDAQGKTGPNAVKEIIGDALRNAAMRFGAALDLWHKGILHMDVADDPTPPAQKTAIGPKGFSAAIEAVKKGEYTAEAIRASHVLTVDQETALDDAAREAGK